MTFAEAYDLLMADVDYEILYEVIKPYLEPTDLIMDAGCGSGYLLVELLRHGHKAVGLDKDTEMLNIARRKLLTYDLNTHLYAYDLSLPLPKGLDVVLAMFDVLNYAKGAKTIIRHIVSALNDGGRFIFDVYRDEVLKTYDGYQESEEDPIPYHWHIKTHGKSFVHQLDINGETFRLRQYVQPLGYYLDILENLGCTYHVIEGPDERKHYIIAYK